jgi:hypothetical protein
MFHVFLSTPPKIIINISDYCVSHYEIPISQFVYNILIEKLTLWFKDWMLLLIR